MKKYRIKYTDGTNEIIEAYYYDMEQAYDDTFCVYLFYNCKEEEMGIDNLIARVHAEQVRSIVVV